MTVSSQQHANLADHTYGRNLDTTKADLKELVGKDIWIDGVQYTVLAHADKPSGYQGTIYQKVSTGEIVVAHRGTEFDRELIKDGVLADGGMLLGRVNSQANDAIELTNYAKNRAQQDAEKWGAAPEVTVTGHSLGGTLVQITAHHFGLKGETFNAYGAASLGYRIPEGGDAVINHVMATDPVSAASPHYGQVRVYASRLEIAELTVSGYANDRNALEPRDMAAALKQGGSNWHYMHQFLNVDGQGKADRSFLADPQARALAAEFDPMIDKYRSDVGNVRGSASMTAGIVGIAVAGPALMPSRTAALARIALQPDLEPGEPARLEAETRARRSNASAVAVSVKAGQRKTRPLSRRCRV